LSVSFFYQNQSRVLKCIVNIGLLVYNIYYFSIYGGILVKLVLPLTSIISLSQKEEIEVMKYWGKKANDTNKPQEEEFELLN